MSSEKETALGGLGLAALLASASAMSDEPRRFAPSPETAEHKAFRADRAVKRKRQRASNKANRHG